MAGLLYNLLLIIFLPLTCIYFLVRVFVTHKSNESWRQNLGALPILSSRKPGQRLIWLHGASVGEIMAALPVGKELRRLLPDDLIVVTTVTQTGNAVARKSASFADVVSYLPFDYPFIVGRAFNRMRPDVLAVMEAELWPNLLWAARRRGIPIVLVNGRVTDKTRKRSRRVKWLTSWVTSMIDYYCVQTETDAAKIIDGGAHRESVHVFGNTKFDQEGGKLDPDAVEDIRADLGFREGDPIFVAGSTNPGEEEPVLAAFRGMRCTTPDLRLIIAPRQIQRGEEIRGMGESLGFICALRSEKGQNAKNADVLVLDTFGELGTAYAVGQIAFVGGTLIPKGGHSLFQPILQGKPVLFGPYIFKTRDMAQMAIQSEVGFQVADAEELTAVGDALLADPARRARIEAACDKLVADNRGASARSASLIAEVLAAKAVRQDNS